jgi:solute carrier family 25 oxoglutarate transporter 11
MSYTTRFAFAGVSGIGATLCVHPLDVVRFQMQLDGQGGSKKMYSGGADCLKQVYAKSGVRNGIYAGIDAGIFRQIVYGMPRMAFYTILVGKYTVPGESTPFYKKLLMGSTAGGTAALIGTPSEVRQCHFHRPRSPAPSLPPAYD